MSKWDVPAGMTPVQSFHPEFGYLCPSAGLKRKLWTLAKGTLAVALVTLGAALGVAGLVMPQRAQVVQTGLPAVAAMAVDDRQAMPVAPASAAAEAPAPPPVVPTGNAALAHAQATCDDLSASFLSPGCQPSRKLHLKHATHDARKLATAPLGRADAIATGEPQPALPHAASASETPPAAGAAVPADRESPASPAAEKPAPKKPVKIAQKHAPSRDNAAMDTGAAPPPQPAPLGGLFGFLRPSPRYANGPGLSFWQ